MHYLNLFKDGGSLIEDQAAGDQSIPLELDERAAKHLTALLGFESFELCHLAAALVQAGIRIACRDSRRKVTARS